MWLVTRGNGYLYLKEDNKSTNRRVVVAQLLSLAYENIE
jgi:hypothetical protein